MRPLFNLHYSLVRCYYNGIRRACSFESQNLWQSTFWTCCSAADKAAAAAAAVMMMMMMMMMMLEPGRGLT